VQQTIEQAFDLVLHHRRNQMRSHCQSFVQLIAQMMAQLRICYMERRNLGECQKPQYLIDFFLVVDISIMLKSSMVFQIQVLELKLDLHSSEVLVD
jgi:hypothetical protein